MQINTLEFQKILQDYYAPIAIWHWSGILVAVLVLSVGISLLLIAITLFKDGELSVGIMTSLGFILCSLIFISDYDSHSIPTETIKENAQFITAWQNSNNGRVKIPKYRDGILNGGSIDGKIILEYDDILYIMGTNVAKTHVLILPQPIAEKIGKVLLPSPFLQHILPTQSPQPAASN